MLNLKTIILSQYPGAFLLSLLFLLGYLRARKHSAVRSVLWVLLFGVSLAGAVVLCIMGMQQDLWTLKTIFQFSVWSWIGIAIVLLAFILRVIHLIERAHNRRVMEKELRKAEKQKEDAVAQARAEGREIARQEAEAEAAARAAEEALEAEQRAAEEERLRAEAEARARAEAASAAEQMEQATVLPDAPELDAPREVPLLEGEVLDTLPEASDEAPSDGAAEEEPPKRGGFFKSLFG